MFMVPNNKNEGGLSQETMFVSPDEGSLIQGKWWQKCFPCETKA